MSDTEGEDVRSKVELVLADIGVKPVVRDCSRLGSRCPGGSKNQNIIKFLLPPAYLLFLRSNNSHKKFEAPTRSGNTGSGHAHIFH